MLRVAARRLVVPRLAGCCPVTAGRINSFKFTPSFRMYCSAAADEDEDNEDGLDEDSGEGYEPLLDASVLNANFKYKEAEMPNIIPKKWAPSEATGVLLTRLPRSTSEQSLKDALSGITYKSVEIEDGCMIHTHNKAESEFIAKSISSVLGYKVSHSQALLSTVILKNLPSNISHEDIKKAFSNHPVLNVRVFGKESLQVLVEGAENALKAAKEVEKLVIGSSKLHVGVVQLTGSAFALTVSNLPAGQLDPVKAAVQEAVQRSTGKSSFKSDVSLPANSSVLLRFSSSLSDADQTSVVEKLKSLITSDGPIKFSGSAQLEKIAKPCLLFRKVPHAAQGGVQKLLEKNGINNYSRIVVSSRAKSSKDISADVSTVYFNSAADALQCYERVKGEVGHGSKPIYVAYREIAEPGLLVENIPENFYNEAALMKLFAQYKPAYVELKSDTQGQSKRAVIVLSTEKYLDSAVAGMSNRQLDETHKLKVTRNVCTDLGLELALSVGLRGTVTEVENSVKNALNGAGLSNDVKGIQLKSNVSAEVSFFSPHQARTAQHQLGSHSEALGWWTDKPQHISARVSTTPIETVHVKNVPATVPVQDLLDTLNSGSSNVFSDLVDIISIDRAALVNFATNHQVVPGMKQLKSVHIEGKALKPSRLRGLLSTDSRAVPESHHLEYNTEGNAYSTISNILKQTIYADPATRYAMAKQHFEIALATAATAEELLGANAYEGSLNAATELLQHEPSKERDMALFQLFLQTDSIKQFTNDFDDLVATLGLPDEGNMYNWTQFNAELGELNARYMAEEEYARAQRKSAKMRQRFNWKKWPVLSTEEIKARQMKHLADQQATRHFLNIDPEEADEGDSADSKHNAMIESLGRDDPIDTGFDNDADEYDFDIDEVGLAGNAAGDESDEAAAAKIQAAAEDLAKRKQDELRELKYKIATARRVNYDLTNASEISEKHGVHPSVWSDKRATPEDYLVKEVNGKFSKVIFASDKGKEERDQSVETKYIPMKTYLFDKSLFEDKEGLDWDIDDVEVRKRLLKMKALDNIHQKEADEEYLLYMKESKVDLKLAEMRSKQGKLVDSDNRLWQGTCVTLDYVQKTQPQGRRGSYRALVVVGNLRGTGGFGHGKGMTPESAVYAAYRDALLHPHHIDLYDNFGLSHDLNGKHNDIQVQIRSRPRSGRMSAPPLVRCILQSMGVSTASVNTIGRQNPYAVVRATFNALDKHVDLVEYSKGLGKRYVTLKYLYDNGIGL